jgi:alanine racemase
MIHYPLRLTLEGDALVANWRWLQQQGAGAACGAAVKADGYGLGARDVVMRLANEGCRDFFVATWAEAADLIPWVGGASISVLHGLAAEDVAYAGLSPARPVLNTPLQVERWKAHGGGRPCDVMIDTGINRLGLAPSEVNLLDGLVIDTLMSHLACADEDVAANARQRAAFAAVAAAVPARRRSLANSAGICLGPDYAFDLTRPGLALYGGIPRREAAGHIRQVVHVEAQIVQRRRVEGGSFVGYNATWTADSPAELAILNHRLCRRLSARFLGDRAGAGGRGLGARRRPGLDGPHRHPGRRGGGPQGGRLGRARLRPSDRVRPVGPVAI